MSTNGSHAMPTPKPPNTSIACEISPLGTSERSLGISYPIDEKCGSNAKINQFHIVLKGQPATKKNSATLVGGRHPVLIPSKVFKEYETKCHKIIRDMKNAGRTKHFTGPVHIKAVYFLQNHAHWPDLVGLMQATADLLSDEYKRVMGHKVLHREWVLSDDRIIKSWDGTCIAGIDKLNPRVEITIEDMPFREDEPDPYIWKQMQGKLM